MRKKHYKVLCIIIFSLIVVSTAVFAVNNMDNNSGKTSIYDEKFVIDILNRFDNERDEKRAEQLSKIYQIDKEELKLLKEKLGSWEEVTHKLIKDQKNKDLPLEKVQELYEQGYDLKDIEKAEYLAALSDFNPEEILKVRGKSLVNENKQAWDDVISQLNIDTRTVAEKLGIPKDEINKMKNEGMTEEMINDIAVLSVNYKKDYKQVYNEIKNGIKRADIEERYQAEQKNSKEYKEKMKQVEQEMEAELEKMVIEQFGLTQKEAEILKANGITGIDIGIAKLKAEKYGKTIDEIVKLKNEMSNWQTVDNVLGGEK